MSNAIVQVLTADGLANGTLTMASTAGFIVGAEVILGAKGQQARRLEVMSITDGTKLVVKVAGAGSPFDASAYLVSDGAKLAQVDASVSFPTPGNNVTIPNPNAQLTNPININTGSGTATNSIVTPNTIEVGQIRFPDSSTMTTAPTGGGGGGGVDVKDEGTTLGTATALNFVGDGVQATFGSGTGTVTVNKFNGGTITGTFSMVSADPQVTLENTQANGYVDVAFNDSNGDWVSSIGYGNASVGDAAYISKLYWQLGKQLALNGEDEAVIEANIKNGAAQYVGGFSAKYLHNTNNGTTTNVSANYGEVTVSGATNLSYATGLDGEAYIGGSGTIDVVNALYTYAQVSGTATVPVLNTIRVDSAWNDGATVGTNVGIQINDQSGVATDPANNFAICYGDPSNPIWALKADGSITGSGDGAQGGGGGGGGAPAVIFSAYGGVGSLPANGSQNVFTWSQVPTDSDNGFNGTNGYVIPADGKYKVSAGAGLSIDGNGIADIELYFLTNGTSTYVLDHQRIDLTDSGGGTFPGYVSGESAIIDFTAGDVITIAAVNYGDSAASRTGGISPGHFTVARMDTASGGGGLTAGTKFQSGWGLASNVDIGAASNQVLAMFDLDPSDFQMAGATTTFSVEGYHYPTPDIWSGGEQLQFKVQVLSQDDFETWEDVQQVNEFTANGPQGFEISIEGGSANSPFNSSNMYRVVVTRASGSGNNKLSWLKLNIEHTVD